MNHNRQPCVVLTALLHDIYTPQCIPVNKHAEAIEMHVHRDSKFMPDSYITVWQFIHTSCYDHRKEKNF